MKFFKINHPEFRKKNCFNLKYFLFFLILMGSCQGNPVSNPAPNKSEVISTETVLFLNEIPPLKTSTPQAGNRLPENSPKGCAGVQMAALHSDPDPESKITAELEKGQCADIIRFDRGTRWVYISGLNSEGWVSLEDIKVSGTLHDLPTITPSAVPKATRDISLGISATVDPQSLFSGTTGELIQQSYFFEYNCQSYEIALPIIPELDRYFSHQDKAFYYTGELPENWLDSYYRSFLISTLDQDPLQSTIDLVQKETGAESSDELAISLIRLTQYLDYDCNKFFSYENLIDDEYDTSFPYETLADQSGVCGDFSLLIVKLLKEIGYGTALLLYDQVNHMAAGIQCPLETASYVSGNTGYCYIETTAPTRIGFKPELINGIPFKEDPHIIPVSSGNSFDRMIDLKYGMEQETDQYGDYILSLVSCADVSLHKTIKGQESSLQVLEGEISTLDQRLDKMKDRIDLKETNYKKEGCEGSLSQEKYDSCKYKYEQLKTILKEYNQIVDLRNNRLAEYNDLYEIYQEQISRFNQLINDRSTDCSILTYETFDSGEQ
jgi:hypothetical protein